MAESTSSSQFTKMSGWLFKWSNSLLRYQKRWFVLFHGYLSYYRDQSEMDYSYIGSMFMYGASVFVEQSNTIIVSNGDNYRIKTADANERSRWVKALVAASRFLSHPIETNSSTDSVSPFMSDLDGQVLRDLRTQQQLTDHRHIMQGSLSVMEVYSSFSITTFGSEEINEHSSIFRASTSTVIGACSNYLDLADIQSDKWLKNKTFDRQLWSDNVIQLVRGIDERYKKETTDSSVIDSSVDSTCTVVSDSEPSCSFAMKNDILIYPAFGRGNKNSKNKDERESKQSADAPTTGKEPKKLDGNQVINESKSGRSEPATSLSTTNNPKRRTQIPERPPNSMSLWTIIKNQAGKDLSKMPVPIHFSEPLSFLQRLTEDFEYSHILDNANVIDDPAEQLAYVACFAVSSYSNTPYRTTKPFNPLLGETYECDRIADMGWRSIAEQVSHHPPISVLHCEGKCWTCWLDQSVTTKFQGQSLSFVPSGEIHLQFKSGNHYVWNKVTSNIHNVIIGKLWVDQEGDMNIKCSNNGFSCKVSFLAPGYFGGEPHKVKGYVYDECGNTKVNITGGYDSQLEISRVNDPGNKSGKNSTENDAVWIKKTLPDGSDKYYNFTVFACQLNEMESGIAPTDSRLRPDQRLMENGQWEEAILKKTELEENQRAAKKKKGEADNDETHVPVWFKKEQDPHTSRTIYVYKGEYWNCKLNKNWSRCPTIF